MNPLLAASNVVAVSPLRRRISERYKTPRGEDESRLVFFPAMYSGHRPGVSKVLLIRDDRDPPLEIVPPDLLGCRDPGGVVSQDDVTHEMPLRAAGLIVLSISGLFSALSREAISSAVGLACIGQSGGHEKKSASNLLPTRSSASEPARGFPRREAATNLDREPESDKRLTALAGVGKL